MDRAWPAFTSAALTLLVFMVAIDLPTVGQLASIVVAILLIVGVYGVANAVDDKSQRHGGDMR